MLKYNNQDISRGLCSKTLISQFSSEAETVSTGAANNNVAITEVLAIRMIY